MNTTFRNIILGIALSSALSACGAADRIANIGKPPEVTKIQNPQLATDYQPVSMPMPAPQHITKQPNSLWAPDRTTFFQDQRASKVGDILTVLINIDDTAQLDNETKRSRKAGEGASMPQLLGLQNQLSKVLPEDVSPTDLVDVGSDSTHDGKGSIDRTEAIDFRMAAVVTQVLPNGNMVIHGKQEARVNFEKRVMQIDGVIRPEDISVDNTINHDQIAEARITYGGQGQITDVQQPRYGQQLYDVVFPF